MEASIAGSASGTSRIGLYSRVVSVGSVNPTQMPISFRLRNGTTTRVPGTTAFARPSATRYENVVNSGSGSATSASTLPAVRESPIPKCNAQARCVRQGNRAVGDGRALKRIVRQQRGAVEVRVVEQRRQVRRRGDPETRFDHATGHHGHVMRARGRNDAHRFAQSPALRELEVHAVHRPSQSRYVRSHDTRLVGNDRQRRPFTNEAKSIDRKSTRLNSS